ncbi:hypothetical protein [Massilibacteroides sp.]|uniref:hypothetical protein n=1 Tax=Massilibacteroides sp. TaxID=2034766 RepID=UPI00262C06BA|nr:hypothetical protein [Massilibacteroides sp.]MDD4515803.1 hypothetical protein [Massilibacteroides sp.]
MAGGTTAGLLEGQSFEIAFGNSFKGIGQSMAIGGAIGVGTTAGKTRTTPNAYSIMFWIKP